MTFTSSEQDFSAFEASIGADFWLRLGSEDPRAPVTLGLAYEKKLDLVTTVKTLNSQLSPRQILSWLFIGYPSDVQAGEMARVIERVVDHLELGAVLSGVSERNSLSIDAPNRLSAALFNEAIPCTVEDSIHLLGRAEANRRPRAFAQTVNDYTRVA